MHPLELIPGLTVVRNTHKALHERGGSFHRVLGQGIHTYIPVYDQVYKVNTTEQMTNVNPSDMITKDNLNAEVDLVVYYKVKSENAAVKKAVYNVDDYESQIVSLAQTAARNVIGTKKFEVVNNDRAELNTELMEELDKETDDWGIDIVRVEMEEITPPSDVQDSMNEIIKAENEKDAAEDFATAEETKADGEKRAEIKRAEGEKQAQVLRAEGKAQAIQKEAKAKSTEIELVNNSISEHFTAKPQEYKKLETVVDSLKDGSKYIIDSDNDLTTVLSEVGGVTPIDEERDEEEIESDVDVDIGDTVEKAVEEEGVELPDASNS